LDVYRINYVKSIMEVVMQSHQSEFDDWLERWRSRTTMTGKAVASEEEAIEALFDLERIVGKETKRRVDRD
jgi:hypothetical protein